MGNANPANTTFLRWLSLLIISLLSRPADAQSGNGDYDTYTTWSEFVTEYLEQNIDEDALEAESDLRQDLQFMEDLQWSDACTTEMAVAFFLRRKNRQQTRLRSEREKQTLIHYQS